MGVLTVVALSIIVIGVTYLWITRNRSQAKSVYETAELGRNIVGGVLIVLAVYTFFQSGDPLLIAAGIIALMFVTAFVLIERPHKELA